MGGLFFSRKISVIFLLVLTAPLALFYQSPNAQPLLIVGRADAKISGAFSYEFLKSPLSRPMDYGLAEASLNLPINASAQAQKFLGSFADSAVVMPSLFARISQDMNAHVDVSAPVFGGILFFAARENASLAVTGSLGDTYFNLDTTLSGAGAVLLKGSIHLPLQFEMAWRSLTFGYAYQPVPWLTLAFQIHKHLFSARTSGDLRPDIAGRITVGGDQGNTSFLVEYPDTKVYGAVKGAYQGVAWSPEMAVGVSRFRLLSRMGARMNAKGQVDVNYSVPYFIDPENFQPRFTEVDSFLAADNLRRLLDGEVGKKSLHIQESLILKLPQSHTLSFEIISKKLVMSYTKVFGNVSIHAETKADTTTTNVPIVTPVAGAVSLAKDTSSLAGTDGFVDLDLFPDQVFCLTGTFGWFHADLGVHTLNINYRNQNDLLTGLSPLAWNGDPFVPILDFGFTWGFPIVFSLDLFVSPLPAVRSGLSYGF